jgi:hypothetical protein
MEASCKSFFSYQNRTSAGQGRRWAIMVDEAAGSIPGSVACRDSEYATPLVITPDNR